MTIYTDKHYNTGELNILTMEKKFIIKALKVSKGRRKLASNLLEITERTLYRKMVQHSMKGWNVKNQ